MNRIAKVLLALVSTVGLSGCGLFDSGGIGIDIPDQTFDFSLDATALVQQLESELGVSLQGQTQIPDGLDVNQSFNIDVPPAAVDLSDEPDIKKYVDAGKVTGVVIKKVLVNIATNSFNYDIPQVQIYIDEASASAITASSSLIGVTPSIPAGQTVSGELSFTSDGRQILSDYLLSLAFSMLARTEITIDTASNRTIPSGLLEGQVTLGLRFTVEPL